MVSSKRKFESMSQEELNKRGLTSDPEIRRALKKAQLERIKKKAGGLPRIDPDTGMVEDEVFEEVDIEKELSQ